MKNYFLPTYKIKYNGRLYLNFQEVCLWMTKIADGKLTPSLKTQMLKQCDMNSFFSVWKMIDPDDDSNTELEPGDNVFLSLTEKQICDYLCLAIFISKIGSSKYFIYMKEAVPNWKESMLRGFTAEVMAKHPEVERISVMENYVDIFMKKVMVLVRFAKRKLKPHYIDKIDAALNYTLI